MFHARCTLIHITKFYYYYYFQNKVNFKKSLSVKKASLSGSMREDITCKHTFFTGRTQTLPLNDVVDSLSVLTVIIESGSKFMDLKFEKQLIMIIPTSDVISL